MTKTLPALLLLLGLLAPSAAAGGTLEAGVLVATVEDERGDACALPVAGFCFFVLETDGTPGNTSLDAYQRVRYAGVAVDLSAARGPLGDLWLLPDAGLTVSATDARAPNPATPLASETWRDAERPEATDRLDLREDGVHLRYPRPNATSPGSFDERDYPLYWSREESVQYDEVGPFHRMAGAQGFSSDDEYDGTLVLLCGRGAPCEEGVRERWAEGHDALPGVLLGLEFYDVQVATDPSGLTPPFAQTVPVPPSPDGTRRGLVQPVEETVEATPPAPARDAPADPTPAPGGRGAPAAARPPSEPPVRVLGESPAPPPPQLPVELIVGATAAGILLVALGAGLYSRFHGKGDILRSKTRDRLVDVIRQHPGISVTDAAVAVGISRNALQHHVRMLERVQVVRAEDQRRRKALYLANHQPAVPAAPAWLLKNPACATLVRAIQENPHGLPREAAHALLRDLPERTRNYNIRKLLAVGIVEQVAAPGGVRLLRPAAAPTPAAPDDAAP